MNSLKFGVTVLVVMISLWRDDLSRCCRSAGGTSSRTYRRNDEQHLFTRVNVLVCWPSRRACTPASTGTTSHYT